LGFSRVATALRRAPWPVYVLLVAAYPVLFLYGQNVGELVLGELVAPLAVVVGTTAVVLIIAGVVAGDVRRAAIPVATLAVALLVQGHVSTLLAPLGVPGLVRLGVWVALILGAVVLAVVISARRLPPLTRGLNLLATVLVVLALVSIVPTEIERFGKSTSAATLPGSAAIGSAGSSGGNREIWYLIFDRYGSRESLERLNGWDDGPFLDSLRERGFVVAEDSHANYLKTPLSLAATLNLDYLDDLVAAQGVDSNDYNPVYERISNHAVGRFLKQQGYEYVHVGSWFGRTRTSAIADRNLYETGDSDFVTTLEEASALPAIRWRLGLSQRETLHDRIYQTTRAQLDLLDELADDPARRFVFGHVLLPHPPYVFTADGSYADAGSNPINPEAHNGQITYLHTRMLELIDRLQARPEAERPIIILQGDEGPFPVAYAADPDNYDWSTASDEDIQIKFGILNAWFVPDDPPLDLPATISSVNTFRILFDREFGADLPILPDRSFVSRSKERLYDLTDVTDRLESPGND
jgi:hypothetical protein